MAARRRSTRAPVTILVPLSATPAAKRVDYTTALAEEIRASRQGNAHEVRKKRENRHRTSPQPASPRIFQRASAAVGLRAVAEVAVEFGDRGPVGGDVQFG